MRNATKSDAYDFTRLLRNACDDSFRAALDVRTRPNYFGGTHYDYPAVSWYGKNGMPYISTSNFGSPVDFGSAFTSLGKYDHDDLYSGPSYSRDEVPEYVKFLEYIESNARFSEYFSASWTGGRVARFYISNLISSCIGKHFHDHGDSDYNGIDDRIIHRCVKTITNSVLQVSAVVPIALTKFDVAHFKIDSGLYIFRMGERTHLRRAKAENHGSGASMSVVNAATHALVSQLWTVKNDRYEDIAGILNGQNAPPYELIDRFFAAMRLVTGYETGYGQALYIPRGWQAEYLASLPKAYGTTIRKYPARFDNFGWNRESLPQVTKSDLVATRDVYLSLSARQENKIGLATKRLNACMTRDDIDDAIVDATIALEVLLGDEDPQATTYKLRMRAGALARLDGGSPSEAASLQRDITSIYKERSNIVHGNISKKAKSSEIREPSEKRGEVRVLASDTLRTLLRILLKYPKYIEVAAIDRDLLIG